jgi:hypothetical protein
MTNYTTPELFLVGAANRLVLAGCVEDKLSFASQDQVNAGLESVSCREEPGNELQKEDINPF